MRIFLLGATGNSGSRILKFAIRRGHQVTTFVRNPDRMREILGTSTLEGLSIVTGNIERQTELARAMAGHDVVINAAGHVMQGSDFTRLVRQVIDQTVGSLGANGRFWQFGGAAVLDIPNRNKMAIDLPMVPKIYEAHRTNLDTLRRSSLDWSMLCPGPMIDAESGKPSGGLRLSAEQWPIQRPNYTRFLPDIALALAFRQMVPELTITYEDAADVILNNLESDGLYSRKRVGVALPVGQRNFKGEVPGRWPQAPGR